VSFIREKIAAHADRGEQGLMPACVMFDRLNGGDGIVERAQYFGRRRKLRANMLSHAEEVSDFRQQSVERIERGTVRDLCGATKVKDVAADPDVRKAVGGM
jgi:hypothetical protein